jgi:hypothetical protein
MGTKPGDDLVPIVTRKLRLFDTTAREGDTSLYS